MRVSAQARVRYAGHDYSMPPGTIGQPATLHLYPAHVEIVTTTGTAVRHARTAEATSIRPEHRAALLHAVRGVRGKLYFQRQSRWELGPAAEAWLTELVHRRPTQWRRDVEACFPLLQDYGPEPLRAAFAWGVRHGAIGAEYVRTRLATVPPVAEVGS